MDGDQQHKLSMQWIADEQHVHERAEYGANNHAVSEALNEQRRRVKVVKDYGSKISQAKKAAKVCSVKC